MIVAVGDVVLQVIQENAPGFARQVMNTIAGKIPGFVAQMMNEYLNAEVTQFLGCRHYQRRRHAKPRAIAVRCSRCYSRERQKFHRDGHYRRNLAICYGQVQIGIPQIEGEYGGKVRHAFKTLNARQRFWIDVQAFVQNASAQG